MKMKYIKPLACLVILIILVIIFINILYQEQKVAILGYHSFVEENLANKYEDQMIMNISKFEKQLIFLKENNYKTLTLDEFYCWKEGECKIPKKSVLITMDDGYASNYYLAFPLLKKYEMNAVVFFVGDYVIKTEESIQNDPTTFMSKSDIIKSKTEFPNIEFASHSYNLHYENAINTMNNEDINNDIQKYLEINNAKYFAYPFGHYNEKIINALKNNNYKMAFTFGPDKNHRKASQDDDNFMIPRLNISNDMSIQKFKLRLILPF